MEQNDWRCDPRLKDMNPEKLNYVQDFAKRIRNSQKDQILPAFLALQADLNRKNIRFSDAETDLLVTILTDGMPPEEKKKLEMLKFLAKKLAARSS